MARKWKETIAVVVLPVFIGWSALCVYSIYLEIKKINVDAKQVVVPKIHPPQPSAPSLNKSQTIEKQVQQFAANYAVQIETVGMSDPSSQTEATGFWVAYIGDDGKTLSPARMIMFMRITNLQGHPVMITRYSVRIGKIKMVKISGPYTDAFYDGLGNVHSVCWINDSDLLDHNLDKLNLQPGIPVQGIALFDWPKESRPETLNQSDLATMRFTIEITDAEGHPLISEPLQVKADPSNESVQSRIVRFNRGTRDLSSFKIKDFSVPHGLTSAPF